MLLEDIPQLATPRGGADDMADLARMLAVYYGYLAYNRRRTQPLLATLIVPDVHQPDQLLVESGGSS
jgi:hypothetical protein